MSALARLDDEAADSVDPADGPLSEMMVELIHALFDAYDTVEKAGIKPQYPEWRDGRDRDQSRS